MKINNTKKALVLSTLALLLCVSMLVGTTFAWFTDSVSSTNNIIKSGNLDVELYWSTTAEENSWKKVDGDTNVFTGQLWEPGHTEVVYLKVVNEGTLALKYNLGVNIVDEKSGINVYYIEVVPEGAETEGPARAAWNTVAAPVLGDATVENGTIKIPYTMLIGPATDGCDRLYIYMYDAAGNEVEKLTLAAQSTGGTAEFSPAASGDYTFKCEAMRTDETTTLAGNSVEVKTDKLLPKLVDFCERATKRIQNSNGFILQNRFTFYRK